MIVDNAAIFVKAGDGGEGTTSSIMYSARRVVGGGGDGGNGGSVIIKVSPHLYDLNKFRDHKKFVAQDGTRGKDKNRRGANGENCIVPVPRGTFVFDEDNTFLVDLIEKDQEYLACQGGLGGEGNFKKTYTTPAHNGQSRTLILDYRIPNDVALIGLANSGKTSLFNLLTHQQHKVADYPYTTTSLGWAEAEHNYRRLSFLDTPALKRDAKEYETLHSFLKHLYRSRILLFLSESRSSCHEEYDALKREIRRIDKDLLRGKKIFYLLTKVDTIESIDKKNVLAISVHSHNGIDKLKDKLIKTLYKSKP